jgi:Uncharacterised MFS-type transporter YbfB
LAVRIPIWRAALSAASASLVGIGLARFAYTPLLPAIIDAGWFSPSQAAYLGAANHPLGETHARDARRGEADAERGGAGLSPIPHTNPILQTDTKVRWTCSGELRIVDVSSNDDT